MSYWGWGGYPKQASKAEKVRRAQRAAQRLQQKGRKLLPVAPAGRTIATTFWGRAWCENLESYRDFAYRLERGRSYLRAGAVLHLAVERGRVEALVCGTEVYEVTVAIDPVARKHWTALRERCAKGIGSLVELLQGRLSDAVMSEIVARGHGLFPAPAAVRMTCTCPDGASMCKHVAAAMYGVGTRLDRAPELLFTLRGVDASELVAEATRPRLPASNRRRVLSQAGLADTFGIALDDAGASVTPAASATSAKVGAGRAAKEGRRSAAERAAKSASRKATAEPRATELSRAAEAAPPVKRARQSKRNA